MNNRAPSPMGESPPQAEPQPDPLSDREDTPRRTPSRTGESSATGSSSHFSIHMSADKSALDWEFWSTLLGFQADGWLESPVNFLNNKCCFLTNSM